MSEKRSVLFKSYYYLTQDDCPSRKERLDPHRCIVMEPTDVTAARFERKPRREPSRKRDERSVRGLAKVTS